MLPPSPLSFTSSLGTLWVLALGLTGPDSIGELKAISLLFSSLAFAALAAGGGTLGVLGLRGGWPVIKGLCSTPRLGALSVWKFNTLLRVPVVLTGDVDGPRE